MSSVISTVKEPKQMNDYEDDTVKVSFLLLASILSPFSLNGFGNFKWYVGHSRGIWKKRYANIFMYKYKFLLSLLFYCQMWF